MPLAFSDYRVNNIRRFSADLNLAISSSPARTCAGISSGRRYSGFSAAICNFFRNRFLTAHPFNFYDDDEFAAHVRIDSIRTIWIFMDDFRSAQLDVFAKRLDDQVPILIDSDRLIFVVSLRKKRVWNLLASFPELA